MDGKGTTTRAPETSAETDETVCRIGVRLPPFWPEEPALWFAQVEGQFVLSGITADATKFYHVISQLDHRYAAEVKDIITSPPAENKFGKLKTELVKRLSASQGKRVQQLLMHEELGDRKPSQFLRHLQALAGQSLPESFMATLWSSRLPVNIQTAIASQPNLPLESVADLADRVHEIAPPSPMVASTSSSSEISELTRQMAELSRQVASLQSQVRSRSRSRSSERYQRKPTARRRSSDRFNKNYCYFHNRFGRKARRCQSPCTYSENAYGSRN
ncbi:hypothetical protein K1T71_002833 [Dendrolimus kikuchii]|uniref:Uncharacterized protein n=3 Tax=Dendrolimus kikuchii TaxID=765133 RepID=A0ACC1DE31_9NEOP|nr:hypothetical protein K1T71_015260 [Dendrolimus kikuchii]KAJ0171088.1 hypothetical protein K1T71_013287 [Dendrolimus kikuchii]KAJ0179598.1 hypothetical protein K1T71_005310 [Dendrolimus kikuchii]KAJ0182111.1 hypothetical protein K1T71_002833 [Dendrolimus kikuchii]